MKEQKNPLIRLDERPFDVQLKDAQEFFGDPTLTKELESANPYADKDGLIEFICGIELAQDPKITKKLVELKTMLIPITSVVTSYINRYSAKFGPEYKTDPDLWGKVLSHIPLMGPMKLDDQSYFRKTQGIEIATSFVELVLGVATGGGAALTSFQKFLEDQGKSLKIGIEKNGDSYRTATLGLSVEVLKVGDQIILIPKIKMFRVNFSRENTEWNFLCGKAVDVQIAFEYTYGASIFDYESLSNPDVKQKFDKFIADSQKAQIEDSDTFFNGDFEPPHTSVPA